MRHGEEKLPTLQQALKSHNIECMESIFPDTHEKCNENLGIWKMSQSLSHVPFI